VRYLQYLDEALLPEVSLDEHNLTFTVLQGRILGDFGPTGVARGRSHASSER
jgi:hypothetical protein